MTEIEDICLHCKHHKTKSINGIIVADYCKKRNANHHWLIKCSDFSRSLKSRLGLIKVVEK